MMNKNWRIILKELIGVKMSYFYDTKKEIIEPTCEYFEKLKQNGHPVSFVRSDNADENTKLEKISNIKI